MKKPQQGNDRDVQAQEKMLIVNGDLKNNGLRLERENGILGI